MSDQVVALHQLAAALADDLRMAAAARGYADSVAAAKPKAPAPKPTAPAPQAVMVRAIANIETLVTQVRSNPTLLGEARKSTVAKLEAQYGNTLGRIIAVVSGLPLADIKGSNAIVRLLATDSGARASLAHIDPNDGELIETLFDVFVREPRTATRSQRTSDSPRDTAKTAEPLEKDTDHMAQLIAERAQYVIPSIIPQAAIAEDVSEAEEDADQPIDGVRRVEAIDKSKRQK